MHVESDSVSHATVTFFQITRAKTHSLKLSYFFQVIARLFGHEEYNAGRNSLFPLDFGSVCLGNGSGEMAKLTVNIIVIEQPANTFDGFIDDVKPLSDCVPVDIFAVTLKK